MAEEEGDAARLILAKEESGHTRPRNPGQPRTNQKLSSKISRYPRFLRPHGDLKEASHQPPQKTARDTTFRKKTADQKSKPAQLVSRTTMPQPLMTSGCMEQDIWRVDCDAAHADIMQDLMKGTTSAATASGLSAKGQWPLSFNITTFAFGK